MHTFALTSHDSFQAVQHFDAPEFLQLFCHVQVNAIKVTSLDRCGLIWRRVGRQQSFVPFSSPRSIFFLRGKVECTGELEFFARILTEGRVDGF